MHILLAGSEDGVVFKETMEPILTENSQLLTDTSQLMPLPGPESLPLVCSYCWKKLRDGDEKWIKG